MKIIKRNGAEVPFDITKIITAVTKASDSVGGKARLSREQITDIAAAVTDQCQALNRAVSVEEVQDMVENQLMDIKAHDIARHYITYRYIQSLKRQTNTTDERILSLIECQNEEVKRERVASGMTENVGGDGTVKKRPTKVVKVGRNDLCPCGSGLKWKKCTCKEYHS